MIIICRNIKSLEIITLLIIFRMYLKIGKGFIENLLFLNLGKRKKFIKL